MQERRPEFMMPALTAGSLAGLLSALPLANCCCCLWPIAGGFLAVFLYRKRTPSPLGGADGAVLGALSGLASAAARSLLLIPLQKVNLMVMQKFFLPYVLELFERSGQQPPQQLNDLLLGDIPPLTASAFFLDLLLSAVLFAGLAALGGVIAVSFLKRKPTYVPEGPHAP